MNIHNPWFPGQANTWSQPQTISGLAPKINFISTGGGASYINTNNAIIFQRNGVGNVSVNGLTGITLGSTALFTTANVTLGSQPTSSAPAIVSATVYQNTTQAYQTLMVPVTYNPTSTAAATCAVALGTSATPATFTTETEPATLTAGRVRTFPLRVPPQWYYSFTVTNATLGTPFMIQE